MFLCSSRMVRRAGMGRLVRVELQFCAREAGRGQPWLGVKRSGKCGQGMRIVKSIATCGGALPGGKLSNFRAMPDSLSCTQATPASAQLVPTIVRYAMVGNDLVLMMFISTSQFLTLNWLLGSDYFLSVTLDSSQTLPSYPESDLGATDTKLKLHQVVNLSNIQY